MDLTEFQAARLNEDLYEAGKFRGDPDWSPEVMASLYGQHPSDPIIWHIARHDPARVLREVEAKRLILAAHSPEPWGQPHPELLRCSQGHGDEGYWTTWPCEEVCAINAVWSNHADYDEAWRP